MAATSVQHRIVLTSAGLLNLLKSFAILEKKVKHNAEGVILHQKVKFSSVTSTMATNPLHQNTEIDLKTTWALSPYSDGMAAVTPQCCGGRELASKLPV